MALRKESEITEAVNKRMDELKSLYDRFNSDYGIWRLTSFQLGAKNEYDNYTSNEPRNLANRVMELLATALLQIRISLKMENEEERANLSNAERFVYGALNLANSRLMSIVQPSIQEQKAFYSTLRGWYGTRAYIHKNKKGETVPDIAIWDILNTAWDTGDYNLLWVCHTRQITQSQAKAEYDIELKGKTAKLYDFWDDEVNSIIIGDTFVKKPEKHDLNHIPVLISMVGPTPFIQTENYLDTVKDMGESIYGANRNIYEPKNKLMTYLMTIVGQGVHNPLAFYSAGGKKGFEKSPYYKGAEVRLDVDKGEKVEPLYKPVAPQDFDKLMAKADRDSSMGGLPPVTFGELNFQLPGYGIQLLTHAATAILAPRQKTMEMSYEWLSRELLTQYSGGGFGKMRLHGRDGSNEYFDVELQPKDVKGDWFPEVKMIPSLPEDEPAKFATMQAAVKSGIFSAETARDKLGVQDTDAEAKKVWREKAEMLPSIQIRKIVHSLIEDGHPELAREALADYQRSLGGNGAQKRAVNPYATGMPENVLPPEEMGRVQLTPDIKEEITQDLRLRQLGLERG